MPETPSIIGTEVTRIDGPLKVTGHAKYGVEYALDNMAWGVGVPSTIGAGKITSIDTAEAEKMPGVLAILHHGNAQKLYRAAYEIEQASRPGEIRPPFEDDQVYYYGQFVASGGCGHVRASAGSGDSRGSEIRGAYAGYVDNTIVSEWRTESKV